VCVYFESLNLEPYDSNPGPQKTHDKQPKVGGSDVWAPPPHNRTTTTAPPPRHVRLAEFQRLCVNMLIKVIKRNNL